MVPGDPLQRVAHLAEVAEAVRREAPPDPGLGEGEEQEALVEIEDALESAVHERLAARTGKSARSSLRALRDRLGL